MNNETHKNKAWRFWAPLLILALVAPMGLVNFNAAQAEEEESLEDIMGNVSSPYKRLKRTYTKPDQKEQTLAYVRAMLVASGKAKSFKPAMTKSIPAAKQAAFVVGYQKGMNVLIREILVFEEAVLDGDMKAAEVSYTKLGAIKKEYHDKFIEE